MDNAITTSGTATRGRRIGWSVDWNPMVSCVVYGGELAAHHGGD
jgi:hypothetical protein